MEINKLLFAKDVALMEDSAEKVGGLVSESVELCEGRKRMVDKGKSKVLVYLWALK